MKRAQYPIGSLVSVRLVGAASILNKLFEVRYARNVIVAVQGTSEFLPKLAISGREYGARAARRRIQSTTIQFR